MGAVEDAAADAHHDDEDAQVAWLEGEALFEQGDYPGARQAYYRAVSADPTRGNALAHARLSHELEHLAFCRQLAARHPESAAAQAALIRALAGIKRWDQVHDLCTEHLAACDDERHSHWLRGRRHEAGLRSRRESDWRFITEDFLALWTLEALRNVSHPERARVLRRWFIRLIAEVTRLELTPTLQALAERPELPPATQRFIVAKIAQLNAQRTCIEANASPRKP